MEFRLVILNPAKEHIIDLVLNTDDPKYKLSGGVIAIMPKKPFLCSGIIIDPDPKKEKPSFQDLSEEEKKKILELTKSGRYKVKVEATTGYKIPKSN